MTFTTLFDIITLYDITTLRHYNIYSKNIINNIEVTRYLFKVNQAIFSGSHETASTLITLRESRELIRKQENYGHIDIFLSESSYF